jgi:hypothetical protein
MWDNIPTTSVYVSQRLPASIAALRQLFLGRDDRLSQALDHQIRWLLPRRFMYQVLEVHIGFTLRRHHTRHVLSSFYHAERSQRLLICVCFSGGFHESYTPTTLGVYRQNCHGLTILNLRGSGYEFGTLSFGGSTTSLVHYIPGALATAFGVPSFRGHNGCIPRRQYQARSSGNRTMGPSTLSTHAPYHGFHSLSTRVPYNGFRALSTHAPYHGSRTLSTHVPYHGY